MPNIFNLKKAGLYRILTIPIAIALASTLTSCKAFVAEELTSEEDFFVDDRSSNIWNSSVESGRMSIYARKFRCAGVKQVGLKSFYIKAGKVTTTTDNYSSNPKSDRADSSSCLFTLFFSPQFDRPWIDFAFPGSPNLVSGSSSPLPAKDSLGYDTQADGSLYQNRRLHTISAQTSINKGESRLIYLKIINSTPPYKIPDSQRLLTLSEIKNFSNNHKDLEFLAIELTWLI